MNLKINEGLSFDDVLLIPGYTDIAPGEADVTSRLIGNIFLNVPIMS
ncbi:MAG: IMP dehydrogenase, partial [Spirochaetia bacterium]|nr:IMP dehydrogenase [Spirochaetia bacterium]